MVKPLIHSPVAVHFARTRGGVVDGAVLERERADAQPSGRMRDHADAGYEGALPPAFLSLTLVPFRIEAALEIVECGLRHGYTTGV